MIVIRTAEDAARALDSPLDPELKAILQGHMTRLAEWLDDFELQQLAVFVIVQAGDTLADAERAFGGPLVKGDSFAMPAELIHRHACWLEAVTILSDDGFGLVLLVEVGSATDPSLLAACMN